VDTNNISLWGRDGLRPEGVKKGGLNDDWLLAVFAALAEYPERIRKIFSNFDEKKGVYEFEMWSQGKATKVVIDDKLPVYSSGQESFAGQSEWRGAMWATLLEKATAKFFGTYSDLNRGHGSIAWQQLTGYPSTNLSPKWMTTKEIIDFIQTNDDNKNVMWGVGKNAYSILGHTNWEGMDFV